MERMPPWPVRESSSGERWPPTRPPRLALGGDGTGTGGRPPFYRDHRPVSFPSRQPPALVGRVHRPLEPVTRYGRTVVRRPRREDAGLNLTELLSMGFLFLGWQIDGNELPLVAQAPPRAEQPAGTAGVRRARLRRTVATSLGASFAFAVAVARAEDGKGNGVAPRHNPPPPAGGEAPHHPPTSEKTYPPPQQQPGAAAVHASPAAASFPLTPASSSSPLTPAAAPTTMPTPPTPGSDDEGSFVVILFLGAVVVILY